MQKMSANIKFAVENVVLAGNQVTPISSSNLAEVHHESRNMDDLAKSMLETHRCSILHHEKMTEWLR